MKVVIEKQTIRLNGKKAVSGIVAVLFLLLLSPLTSVNAHQAGDTFRDCDTCPEMVVLPAGKFTMGSPEGEKGGNDYFEGPQRQVTIAKPFAVGKYEVTVGQYAEFVRETQHETGNCHWHGQNVSWYAPGFKQRNNHPVVCVDWYGAQAYMKWLSEETGHEYRLLTEAEWEYAARAGTTTAYHFGREIFPNQANYDNNNEGTVAVGSYPANAFGLHDMHGNVREWVEDCYHNGYIDAPTDGSAWLSECRIVGKNDFEEEIRNSYPFMDLAGQKFRVLRSGSWDFSPEGLRSASRDRNVAAYLPALDLGFIVDYQNFYNGFRVARTLTPQVGETFRDCESCPEMVVLPAGKFMMGSPIEKEWRGDDDERPQHQVTIPKPFAVGKYEVTVGQYAEFVRETQHETGNCDYVELGIWHKQYVSWDDPGFKQTNNHPVVCVGWYNAQAYMKWLSEETGHEYRLLTEAEWEYAARAGTTTAYHFERGISPNQANYDNNNEGTVAVGSYPANAFGLHDMHGNVWEWVEDCWHDDYTDAPTDGSAWLSGCEKYHREAIRVLRGGSWYLRFSDNLRSAARSWYDASLRNVNNGFGFRVARTLTP